MLRHRVKEVSKNNKDLLDKANYIEDEALLRHYCKMRNINYEDYIKSIKEQESKEKNV